MARTVDVKQQNWARWECDVVAPGAEMLAKICRVHDCSADWLLGLDKRGTSVNAGVGAAVAIGANARATSRTTVAAAGQHPDCARCQYKTKLKKLERFFASPVKEQCK